MEEHAFHDFPIQGPRTTPWLLLEIARGELGQVARHHWWRQAIRLSPSDPGVDKHLFFVTCFASMTNSIFGTWLWVKQYDDGFNCGRNAMPKSCASTSAVFRRGMPRNAISSWTELDQKEALCWPELETWFASQLAEEAAILKERRKGREEGELVAAAFDPRRRNDRKPK